MRCIVTLFLAAVITSVYAGGPPDRVVIHLLDPRGAFAGEQTMSTQWHDGKADVLGMRILNVAESQRLRALLRKDLANDDNVPFCGHSPAYAVSVTPTGKPTTTVTLCGTCGTWAKDGKLRSLHGREALEYLDSLLPLPEVFRPVDGERRAKTLNPFGETDLLPFEQLE